MKKLVAWTTAKEHRISLPLKGEKAEVVDMTGQMRHETLREGALSLKLSHSPTYKVLGTAQS